MRVFTRAFLLLFSCCFCIATLKAGDLQSLSPDAAKKENGSGAVETGVMGSNDNHPPAPLEVVYKNGQLAIRADNCSLRDVLEAVHERTGATIEAPATAMKIKVVANIPAGNPLKVLSDLLRDTGFDYILVRPDTNPDVVQEIILSQRTAPAPVTTAKLAPGPAPKPKSDVSIDKNAQVAGQTKSSADKEKPSTGSDSSDQSQPPMPAGVSSDMFQALVSGYFAPALGASSAPVASPTPSPQSTSGDISRGASSSPTPNQTPVATSSIPISFDQYGNPINLPVPPEIARGLCQLYGMTCQQLYSAPKNQQPASASACVFVFDRRTQSMKCSF